MSGDIKEDVVPGRGLLPPPKSINIKLHNADTRRWLAFTIIGIQAFIYVAVGVGFVLKIVAIEDLPQVVAAFSGLQALAGVALGYYFAKRN